MKNEKTCSQNAEQVRKETTQNTRLTTTVAVTHECVLDMSLLSPIVYNNIPPSATKTITTRSKPECGNCQTSLTNKWPQWRRQSHGSVKPNNTRMNVTRKRVKINTYSVQSSKPKLVDQMHLQRTDILPSCESPTSVTALPTTEPMSPV